MKKFLALVRKYTWVIVAILIVGLFAYSKIKSARSAAASIVVESPQMQTITKTLDLTGHIDAAQKTDLRFSAPSRLAWVGVKEGDMVNKWQAIASLDTRTLQKQLAQDLNNFNKAFRTHDQVLDDNNYYGTPDLDQALRRILENADYDLNNTVINVELRDLAIKLSSLVSPFAGLVTRVDQPNAGVNVSVTDTFQIINPDSLYFSAEVDELDISKIVVGQSAPIVLDAYEGETIESTITKVSFVPVSSASGTSYKVELAIPSGNLNLKYRLGMSGDAIVRLDQKDNVLTIKSQALIERDGAYFVDLKTSAKDPERKAVEIGLETDELVEITAGLTTSDQVIIPQ